MLPCSSVLKERAKIQKILELKEWEEIREDIGVIFLINDYRICPLVIRKFV
jgi:hypothetical protein